MERPRSYAALPSRFREAGARYQAAEFMLSAGRFEGSERLTEAVLDGRVRGPSCWSLMFDPGPLGYMVAKGEGSCQ